METLQNENHDEKSSEKFSFVEFLEAEAEASRIQLYKDKFYLFCKKYCNVQSSDEKVTDLETWYNWFCDWVNHAEDVTKYLDNKELFDRNATEEEKSVFCQYMKMREIFDMHDLAEDRKFL